MAPRRRWRSSTTGLGSRGEAQRVFERFYRADPARSHDGGTGLGLAIVAALVAAHGGTVEVDTHPGSGATFRVLLPLAPDAGMWQVRRSIMRRRSCGARGPPGV